MNENNLRLYVDKFFDELVLYDDYKNGHYYKDLLKAGIDVFFDNENSYNAYEIYRTFFMIYQVTSEENLDDTNIISVTNEPNTLLDLVKIMKKYEESTGDLIERQRDHFIHSVNVFLLGLAIYAQNKNYRKYFKRYVMKSPYDKYYEIDGEFSHEEFLYRWGIASLFHDIGYPVEIIGKQLNKFIYDGVKSISSTYTAQTAIDFKDFNEFNTIVKLETDFADNYNQTYKDSKFLNMFKPTDIMAHKIATDFGSVNVNDVVKHLDSFVEYMGNQGFIDHGFFSAILVLNSYGYLMQKYAKDYDYFFYPIVDSATAILLHNYYRKTLQGEDFNLKELHPSKSPLAYMLILCDELQEWNRQPFGIKDKQKNHVNDFLIRIDDTEMRVSYILRDGSMGLGFSEDKEKLLKELLSIPSIFKLGLGIMTEVKQDNLLKEIVISETEAPGILLRNVEKLAIKIHEQYIETTTEEYKRKEAEGKLDDEIIGKFESLCPYEDLTPQLKIANIRQARSIPFKLRVIGCELADMSDSRPAIEQFSEEEIIDLAIIEHDEWMKEKEGTGWTYGKVKDNEKLITPYLVPWEELTPDVQQYDIDTITNIPPLMDSIGLKIVTTKHRLLTFEMHKLYADEVNFDELPDYIKYSNYKQTDFLIKLLSELGYEIVDSELEVDPAGPLSEEEIEYLAEREHAAWCKLMFNLGWTYDSVKDEEEKTNPNLVDWEDLDFDIQETNKHTFRNLPMLCENVGLKIVKK